MSVKEMAEQLGVDTAAVRMRLSRAGIKPVITEAQYPLDTLDVIRNVPSRGQHRAREAAPAVEGAGE